MWSAACKLWQRRGASVQPRSIEELTTSAVLRNPALQQKLSSLGVEPMRLSPAEFESYVRNEIAANANLVKAAGIKLGQ